MVHSLDPRTRIVSCFIFACAVSQLSSFAALASALLLSLVLFIFSKITFREVSGRLLALNIFFLFFFLSLPFSGQGKDSVDIGWAIIDKEYFLNCCRALIRGNIILLLCISLINTVDILTFAQALSSIRFPSKLVHLMMFTIRYLDIVHCEYLQIKRAVIARGFVPHMDMHTYRTIAGMAASIMIKALDRAERVNAAMKCRCFDGKFYSVKKFALRRGDLFYISLSSLTVTIFIWGEFF